jgi:hypothetical protein
VYDAFVGILRMLLMTVLNESVIMLNNKANKNNGEIFKTVTVYSLLTKVIHGIEIIVSKEYKHYDKDGETVVTDALTDEDIKPYIIKFLCELVSFVIFSSMSLRLNYLMGEIAVDYIKTAETADIQSFFSIIVNAFIIPIEVMEHAVDKGNAEENATEIDNVISSEKTKFLGNEAVKIFYNGLKEMENVTAENGETKGVSRLYNGRKEFFKEAILFTKNVFEIIDDFIDGIDPR